jgi:hypothetical protein
MSFSVDSTSHAYWSNLRSKQDDPPDPALNQNIANTHKGISHEYLGYFQQERAWTESDDGYGVEKRHQEEARRRRNKPDTAQDKPSEGFVMHRQQLQDLKNFFGYSALWD